MIDGNWTRLGGAGKNLLSSTPKQQCFPGSCSRFQLYNAQRRAPLVWKDTWNIRKVLERWIAGAQATNLFFTVSSLLNKRSQAFWALFGCVKHHANFTLVQQDATIQSSWDAYKGYILLPWNPKLRPGGKCGPGIPNQTKPYIIAIYCHTFPYSSSPLWTYTVKAWVAHFSPVEPFDSATLCRTSPVPADDHALDPGSTESPLHRVALPAPQWPQLKPPV